MASIIRITDLAPAALDGLRAESVAEGYRFIGRLCDEWASGANRFDAPGEALFVAVSNGQVAGVCGINCDPYAHDPHTGRVRRLYVARACRRTGVGRALLQAVVAHAGGHFRRLRVRTDEAGAFYIQSGFRRVESEPATTHVLDLNNSA